MRITVGDKEYFVRVRYELYDDVPALVPGTSALAQARTSVSISRPNEAHTMGQADCWCSVLDSFKKSKGKYRAFTRALQAMGVPHVERGAWHAALREAEKNSGRKANTA